MEMELGVVQQEQEQDLQRHSSNGTLFLDFDGVAVLNVWIRHQKVDIRIKSVLATMILQVVMYLLEIILSVTIIYGLVTDEPTRVEQIVCTVLTWLLTVVSTIFLKICFQRNINKTNAFCSNQIGGLWNALLLIMKPCKYFRSLYHRNRKWNVLGKEFIHGETVTREQFNFVIRINREELVDARDDFYEAFLHRIPMAFLQFYFFSNSPSSPQICNLADGCRLLIVILYLISTMHSALLFEWKKQIYLDSLHVLGYLKTNGRFSVPEWTEGHLAYFLKVASHSTSIWSRFFLICFAARVSWGLGIGCFLILLIYNLIITYVYPNVLHTIQNLPLGISISASTFVDRLVSTLSGMTTRFNQLSKYPVKIGSFSTRFPLVLSQIMSFLVAFALLFCFVEIVELTARPPGYSNIQIFSNETANISICKNVEEWPEFFQDVGMIASSVVKFLNIVCNDPKRDFYNALHFHWILFYIHIIVTFIYNLYSHSYVQRGITDDSYPPLVAIYLYKQIFRKLFELRNVSTKINVLSRFLFLIGIKLDRLNSLYLLFRRGDASTGVGSSVWWEDRMIHVLERYDTSKGRYRDYSSPIPDLAGLPIELEIHSAYATIQHLRYSYRLYLFCGHSIDSSLTNEMTSFRLDATIEMLEMSKNELISELENCMLRDSDD